MDRSLPAPPADAYVAPLGDDGWSGRLPEPARGRQDGPFRTLERARDEVRRLRAAGALSTKGGTVAVREGTYLLGASFVLGEADSGSPGAPVVYGACPGEKVVLAGGLAVPPGAFAPVVDPGLVARLDPSARGRVLQADLGQLSLRDIGPFPEAYQGAPSVPELFFNGRRMELARWPNDGWATIARIVAPGSWSAPATCPNSGEGGVFEYEGDRPSRWDVGAGVWLHGYWCFDWHDEVIRALSIDREKRQITLAAPARFGLKPRNPSPRRWRALNLLEELDRPGEYHLDPGNLRLFFWPPAPLEGARVMLSTLKAPVVEIRGATDVVLRGFTIEASLGNGIEVHGGRAVRIEACEVRNTRESGICVEGGEAHRVDSCDVHDVGAGGIALSGGDRKALAPARHEAVNNHVWRFSRHRRTGSCALSIRGVGNRAAHNLVHDAPHQAIGIAGNDHVVEYNVVHHVCTETDDCGACYKGRNPSCRGNLIRFNFWHHVGSSMGHGSAAIYFDDGDGGDTVHGNVFFRCGDPGRGHFGAVYSNGGYSSVAENNVFIECRLALGSSAWSEERWMELVRGGGKWGRAFVDRLTVEVDITRPPYATRYPELAGFLAQGVGTVRVNRAARNVFVRCGAVKGGNWEVPPEENWDTGGDPGFVDAARGDFRFRADAEVFARLPGFQPIPFAKMGLVRSVLRPMLAGEPWFPGARNGTPDGFSKQE